MRVSSNYQVRNPATGEPVGQVQVATTQDIAEAAARARDAQRRWNAVPFRQRAQIIRRFHDLILDRRTIILDTIQSETGKSRRDAFAEIVTVAGTARYYVTHGGRNQQAERGRPAERTDTWTEVVYQLDRASR